MTELNKRVWEYWTLTVSCLEQIHDFYNVQYQEMAFQVLGALEQHCDFDY